MLKKHLYFWAELGLGLAVLNGVLRIIEHKSLLVVTCNMLGWFLIALALGSGKFAIEALEDVEKHPEIIREIRIAILLSMNLVALGIIMEIIPFLDFLGKL